MKTIRKLLGIYGLLALLIACNKQADETDFSVTLRENFTEITKNKANIQVDDYIPYELTISDVDNSTGIEYRLVPIREGNSYHQILWKDYGLFLSNTDSIIDNKPAYVSFSGKGKHMLYIRPLVPGTFKHTYELQKWKGNRQVGDAIKIKENFNAVRLSARYGIHIFPLFVGWFLSVNDGNDETDIYLTEQNVEYESTFEIITQKNIKMIRKGVYRTLGKIQFLTRDELFDKEDKPEYIQKLQIRKKTKGLPEYTIEYYNIKIKNQD